ncbi:MAG: CocE/NonD family hydrolase [Alphaproteobacteria bacterium]|nr:CocE/NonD family hydrolase [Alphaproteobacteria bacterium]
MTTIKDFPRKVKEVENFFITLSDGTKLAARMWLPRDAEKAPVPAVLEYLPYRKRDGTHVRDALTHPYLAGHGYAAIRVDMRGNGDSDGLMEDEYAKQEQDDALEVIAWIARQTWCTGKVGMFGISWGGFNALQVAARKPPALKAIVTICSTDDRYEDDVHYKGGTVINEMLGWAATMLAYSSRPPDPKIVGNKWRKMWMQRLQNEPFLVIPWLSHPHRDAYWKHGSVCEDWAAVEAPTLVVGGWNDAYSNAIPRLMKGLRTSRKAIIGPWAHKYPHFAVPEPRIGFLQEMLRWWDQWLKNEPSGITRDADYRYYIMDAYKPGSFPERINGRWVGDSFWGFGNVDTKKWWLNAGGAIGPTASEETAATVSSRQTTGADGGEYCIIWLGPEFPGDQRRDDEQSITFDTPALITDVDIVGQPAVDLEFSVDKPVAHIAVRLNDVWPTGEVSRITYHLQNLCMRDSRDKPTALEPGKRYRMKIKLDDIAWRIPKGHRIRVSVSTSYFPMMWPAPEPVTLTIYTGKSQLHLPVRKDMAGETPLFWKPAEAAPPAKIKDLKKPSNKRETVIDEKTGELRIEIIDDFGEQELKPHGMIIASTGRETYAIKPDDPLSAKMETHWTEIRKRGTWDTRTETYGRLTATKSHWIVWGRIEAYEGKKKVFEKEFNEKIERKLV